MTDRLCNHLDVIPAPPSSRPWILDSFRGQLSRLEGGPRECAAEQTHALARLVGWQAGTAVVAVPRGYADDFVGWAVELGGALLFVYVREVFRRQGVGSALMAALPLRLPVEVAYWTADADAMAAAGFPIRYEIHAYRALLAFVRGNTPTERAA